MQPAVPVSWVRRPVAASRENTSSESAELPATYTKRPSGEIAIASAPPSDVPGAQPAGGVFEMQPATPASWTSDPLGWLAKLVTAAAVAGATLNEVTLAGVAAAT